MLLFRGNEKKKKKERLQVGTQSTIMSHLKMWHTTTDAISSVSYQCLLIMNEFYSQPHFFLLGAVGELSVQPGGYMVEPPSLLWAREVRCWVPASCLWGPSSHDKWHEKQRPRACGFIKSYEGLGKGHLMLVLQPKSQQQCVHKLHHFFFFFFQGVMGYGKRRPRAPGLCFICLKPSPRLDS